jgi:two-component system LytT family sensor kinase
MPGPTSLTTDQFLLTTLLVKLAVMAAAATILVRFRRFRHFLIFEQRPSPDRLTFALSLGSLLSLGVVARLLLGYQAADLTLEGAFLAGLIDGPYAGVTVGAMVGIPPLLFSPELIALPFAIGCGFAGGGLRELCPKDVLWQFSPFIFTSLPRRAWQMLRTFKVDWQVMLLLAPIGLEIIRQLLGGRYHRLFYLAPGSPRSVWLVIIVFGTVVAVASPIKIWNSARIEHRLQEQEKLLLAAKLEALANQINPHFLFNTLTSISSLIRTQPETARVLITKLSGLLRRLLRSTDHFVTLREELEAIDEYLHIETTRFGPQLKVLKQIHPDTLDVIVPSLILQPLVENSIKHGLSPKVGGGRITITSRLHNGHAVIEVVDDGMGMSDDRLEGALGGGIGLSNVNERLRTIYGDHYQLRLKSAPGQGTAVSLEIPELALPERVTA